jgi:apolipoprotein D and lipocalin family protein
MSRELRHAVVVLLAALTAACSSAPPQAPLRPVSYVDLNRFMGDWYVLANIPTKMERGAHNAIESYRLAPDGRVLTTFTFRDGAFDGPEKRYEPVGFIRNRHSNAVWGMQFMWPFKADYRIAYLDEDYRTTIVAREARDYVWIMARTPSIETDEYDRMVGKVRDLGYDVSKLQRVPQQQR